MKTGLVMNWLKTPENPVIPTVPAASTTTLGLSLEQTGNIFRTTLHNYGNTDIRVKEVIIAEGFLPVPPESMFYAESYNMLSEYSGTLSDWEDIGDFHSDVLHYRMPQNPNWKTVYNMAAIVPPDGSNMLLGFTSCFRYRNEFRFRGNEIQIAISLEDSILSAGDSIFLEELIILEGPVLSDLLADFADQIQINHPRLAFDTVPTGWCSWSCYGPDITKEIIRTNLKSMSERLPNLRYVQIDDGYQAYMGDWLDPNPVMGGNVRDLCHEIAGLGFEPAIWAAPFIAQAESKLFAEHPDWFVKDENNQPMSSEKVTFGGWRCAPWYILDGSHPEACDYLRHVFHTIRTEWKCHYFKLDAQMWGAIPGGVHYDPQATSIDAYRRGMKAVLEGAGEGAYILGCNAPMWPSLGVVHGMRLSDDIFRSWDNFASNSRQMLYRNWQHQRLWINDPDALLLENLQIDQLAADGVNVGRTITDLSPEEFRFHAASVFATGGMILSGDIIPALSRQSADLLIRFADMPHPPAEFSFPDLRTGIVRISEHEKIICLLNRSDEPGSFEIPLNEFWQSTDLLTGNPTGNISSIQKTLLPHDGALIHLFREKG